MISLSVMANPAAQPANTVNTSEVVTAKNVITGKVVDLVTNESLPGAAIKLNQETVYSDFEGNFRIEIASEANRKVEVSLISYKNQTIDIQKDNCKSLNIKLTQH